MSGRSIWLFAFALTLAGACRDDYDGNGGASPDTLLSNGSFEAWAGSSPNAWVFVDASGEKSTDEPLDGDASVRVTASNYGSIEQEVSFNPPLDAGTTVEAAAMWKPVSGPSTVPELQLDVRYVGASDGEYPSSPFASVPSEGPWAEGSLGFVAEQDVDSIKVLLIVGQGDEQVVEFDRASLEIVE